MSINFLEINNATFVASKKNKVFGLDENKISILTKNKIVNYSKFSKLNCANLIVDSIYNEIKNK